ncbi:MAG: EF-P beta-lysylation protein EpmB [Gammaproteobacteria bacterium]|nr:MAG: EF-P beta-lysylation protein EpmB [Gammaproteobacteria bacterium]
MPEGERILQRKEPPPQRPARPAWREELRRAVRDPAELLRLLGLPLGLLPELRAGAAAAGGFPLRVPRPYLARMRRGDPADPLLRQVLPSASEGRPVPGFAADPLEEARAQPLPGLLRKYRGRALLVLTGACAVHCRYCFRRHFPYGERALDLEAALAALARDSELEEVILSGGDPLVWDDGRLGALAARLARLPGLRRLRLHTRLPVVLPQRVDEALLAWLEATPLQAVMVIHCNHPREVDAGVRAALGRLRQAGVTLLNQAVLLRGVNDSVEALAGLSEALFEAGVLPYYLHLLDRVAGAAHFEVPEGEALRLVAGLRARLPGYLVPRLARERPGAPAKEVLA